MELTEEATRRQLHARLAALSVDQYHRMIEAEVLPEGAPVELIDGLLICKDRSACGEDPMTIGKAHDCAVSQLLNLVPLLSGRGCFLKCQGAITLPPRTEPEPDAAIVRGAPPDYLGGHPGPADVSCVIEVADSSLEHDRIDKLRLYARAGIRQYVIVNIPEQRVEVNEQPVVESERYAAQAVLRRALSVEFLLPSGDRVHLPAEILLP